MLASGAYLVEAHGLLRPASPAFADDRWLFNVAGDPPPAGWWRIATGASKSAPTIEVCLADDLPPLRFTLRRRRQGWSALVRFSAPPVAIALSSAEPPTRVVAAPAGKVAVGLALAARGAVSLWRDPGSFPGRAARAMRLLAGRRSFALPEAPRANVSTLAYGRYLEATATDVEPSSIAARMAALGPEAPGFSILVPIYRPDPDLLAQTLQGALASPYAAFEVIAVDDSGQDGPWRGVLSALAARDPRLRVVVREKNGGISAALNEALAAARHQFALVLDQDDVLAVDALVCLAEALTAMPGACMAYADEDKIDPSGRRVDPCFKPAWSPDLLLGQNYLNHPVAFDCGRARALGGFNSAFDGAQDWDLYLRLTDAPDVRVARTARVLYSWRAGRESTASFAGFKPLAAPAGVAAVSAALARRGARATAEPAGHGGYVKVVWSPPAGLVSVLTPTRDRPDLLAKVAAALLETDHGVQFEWLIADNGGVTAEGADLLKALARDPRVRVLRDDRPFNFAGLNNAMAHAACGDVLVLLNDDAEPVGKGFLAALTGPAARADVGAVGATLAYPNGGLQHAGLVLGLGGAAGNVYRRVPADWTGPFGRLGLIREVSAVTAAAMAMRAEVWRALGGMDEAAFAVAFNDVDLCLRARAKGLRCLVTPQARAIHFESASRGLDQSPREDQERVRFMQRWREELLNDPYYHPALTRDREDGGLA